MINRESILQWSSHVPWSDNVQVEQDLIISRVLTAIFSDEFLASQLAFRGGTAMHKLYLSPQPRYSEDIDLVQINAGPIKSIMFRLGEVLDFLPDRVTKQKRFAVQQPPTYKQFIANMEEKMTDPDFLGDTTTLLRSDLKFNPQAAYDLVKTKLIDKLK